MQCCQELNRHIEIAKGSKAHGLLCDNDCVVI